MAAETESGAHGAEAAGHSAGLPQFDATYFPSQLFWLVVFFTLLYLLLDRALLPRVGGVIAQREGKIKGDIDAAAKANEEAKAALAGYDAAIAGARKQGRDLADAARSQAAAVRAARIEAADATLDARLTAAETRLSALRAEGAVAAEAAAQDVAEAIIGKLMGAARAA